MNEDLGVSSTSTVLPGGSAAFGGILVTAGNTIAISDRFETRNDFYGGQLGGRAEFHLDRVFVNLQGALAVGNVHQVVSIGGGSSLTGPGTVLSLKPRATASKNAAEVWALANGSVARAFASNAGDSYTASLAIVDEADLVPDLDRLLRWVKPTIDGGGKMVLVSRADKSKPQSEFKRLCGTACSPNHCCAPRISNIQGN